MDQDQNTSENQIKVLIVEDDPALSKMYSTKFKNDGFNVEVAHDGAEGLAKTAEFMPNIILLDMMLPKYTGIEFLEQIQHHLNIAAIPVICLTNLTEQKEADRARELGAKEYLAKAMHTPEEIVNVVRKYVGGETQQPSQEEEPNQEQN